MNSKLTLIADKDFGQVLAAVSGLGAPRPLSTDQVVSKNGFPLRFGRWRSTNSETAVFELLLRQQDLATYSYDPTSDTSSEALLRAPREHVVVNGVPYTRDGIQDILLRGDRIYLSIPVSENPESQQKWAKAYSRQEVGAGEAPLIPEIARVMDADQLTPAAYNRYIQLATTFNSNTSYLVLLLVDGYKACLVQRIGQSTEYSPSRPT